ncbi:histone acetyltransferase KAT6B-like isoform X2 [Cydia pomonella]|uniref:histone acetyltransferase KAT6B-like isoform X2 n=1 Tax=Cydia pomonella TaxID=82600 RepID=UPI002ADD8D03|nr:histone acetyltransferase KAT6B-like isoform X2 [Cydia pomonella]
MSDMEEPPMKVLKMDVAPSSLDSTMEGQEEGQEEWLSEGVLTDDDYMAANSSQEQQPDANTTAESSQNLELEPQQVVREANITMEQNIEETLNNLEGMESSKPSQEPASAMESESQKQHEDLETVMQQDIEDTLNNFEGVETAPKDEFNHLKNPKDSEPSHSEHSDDGHNTDELLRMLGEDDGAKKKVLTTIREKNARRAARSSEEDYFLEGAKVTKLKVAKNAIIRTQPVKAEPENFSDRDSDMSDDEGSTVKRMFTSKPRPTVGRALKSSSYTKVKTEKPAPTPVKQYTNTSKNKSLLKPKKEHPEIINEEEFLEDDDFDLDEDVGEEWQPDDEDVTTLTTTKSQPIRRPERMDEEIPSDDDSHSEDDSLYDVMPSSDSDDMDDWFTLDIRAERAGDYLPWLGDKAHKLLTEEKHRVSSRLAALRQSMTALQSSGRVQNDQIKVATEALHELDAMLAAA